MCDIVIDADYREKRSGVIEALQNRTGVTVNPVFLEYGDYRINNLWLLERKTLTDLATSIVDGRLFRQLTGFCFPYRRILLIEGTGNTISQCKIQRQAIQGALITIALCFGIPVLRSMNCNETAGLLIMIGRQWNNFSGVMDSSAMGSQPRRSKNAHRQRLNLLQCLPCVGALKARALLQRFGSIEGVLLSSVEELAQTPGIGRKTALAIRQMVCVPTQHGNEITG